MIGWGFKARKAQKSQERPSKQRWGLCGNNFLGPCFGDRILDQKKRSKNVLLIQKYSPSKQIQKGFVLFSRSIQNFFRFPCHKTYPQFSKNIWCGYFSGCSRGFSMGFSQSKAARAPVKKTSIACLAGKKKITPSGWCLATRTFFVPTPGADEVVLQTK